MASLGLNFHVDKENATMQPGLVKGDGIRFGLQNKNKGLLSNATPRKVLKDVNSDSTHPNSLKPAPGSEFRKPQQQAPKLSMRPGNQLLTPQAGNDQNLKKKKPQLQDNKNQLKQSGPKSAKPKRQETKIHCPIPDDEDGYDSDTILPRSERASSHIHKLLSWRPPCLFGSVEDSDSDLSLSEDVPQEILISEPVMELPDIDLSSMLDDLPDPEKP